MNNKKLAFIYDLDGTLSSGFVVDDCLIAPYGDDGKVLWNEIVLDAKERNMDPFFCFFYHIANYIKKRKPKGMSLNDFYKKNIDKVKLFPGVLMWFDKINDFGRQHGFEIEHFIVSAGIRGTITHLPFADKCTAIFASDYITDGDDNPMWLSTYVSSTAKTEYIFRISKGSFDNFETHKIFDKKDKETRYVQIKNMIYFGDGDTDIPVMKVIRRKGGHAVAVFGEKSKDLAEKLLCENRVDYIAPANYEEGSELYKYVQKLILEKVENK